MENDSRKPRDLLKNRHSDSLKKDSTYSFSGMLKKGDVDDDAANDDEVRTSASQNCTTATLRRTLPQNSVFIALAS